MAGGSEQASADEPETGDPGHIAEIGAIGEGAEEQAELASSAEVDVSSEFVMSTSDRTDAEPANADSDSSDMVRVVRALERQVAEHHSRAAAREQVIDNLHAEVERRRAGEGNLLLRPVVTDLQNLREGLLREAETLPAELTSEQAAELLRSFALSVEQALERCGSVPIEVTAGDDFSPRSHRAVRRVAAEDARQDATVAAVVAGGYQATETGRVTTPARVHVYRWTPSDSPGSDSQRSNSPGPDSHGQAPEQENADV